MATVTFDGQSLMIDGRREWLVSGTFWYSRTPAGEWPRALASLRDAGFNTVLLPVVWAHHAPARGEFRFEGDADLAECVRLAGRLGLKVILRMGPHVGGGEDLGGIPAWAGELSALGQPSLWRGPDGGKPAIRPPTKSDFAATMARVRSGSGGFIEDVARWFTALGEQVEDLQATSRVEGPIVLAQVEHEWFCEHDVSSEACLAELSRFARESGVTVPLCNANNLHASSEGDIDAWSGDEEPLLTARQLRSVRPQQPAMLLEIARPPAIAWGDDLKGTEADGRKIARTMGEACAGGAQFNLARVLGGTRTGFSAGAIEGRAGAYSVAAADVGTLIASGGAVGEGLGQVKRIATFASHFGRVLAHADPSYAPVSFAPGTGSGASVVPMRGPRGGVAFILFEADAKPPSHVTLARPNGSTLVAPVPDQPATWVLFDTHLVNRSTLDWCTFCAFAQSGRVFVCYGPAGARASVSINGSALELTAPTGQTPVIEEHEGIVIVVCSEALAEATVALPDGVHVGVRGVSPSGEPAPHPSFRTRWRISADGEVSKSSAGNSSAASVRAPSLTGWTRSACDAHVSGTHSAFKTAKAPASLVALGAPTGYAWCRLAFKGKGATRTPSALVIGGDRVHLFADGKRFALIGNGPGGGEPVGALPARQGGESIVALIDNLGRIGGEAPMGEPKGLYEHVWSVSEIRAGKPKLAIGAPFTPLVARTPIIGLRAPDSASAHRVTWSITRRKKTPVWVRVREPIGPAVLFVNDAPVELLEWWGPGLVRIPEEALKGGKNVVQIAPIEAMTPPEEALKVLSSGVHLYEGAECLTDKCDWAYALWKLPEEKSWERVAKPRANQRSGVPTWWRCSFKSKPDSPPMLLDAAGLTKGQLFLNGRNLCRYWVASPDGKPVPTQRLYRLPAGWLEDGDNSLALFDEHGASPSKARIVLEK